MERWLEAVQRVMAENQLENPYQLIWGFLVLLKQQHEMAQVVTTKAPYNDGLDHMTGQHANTFAESLEYYARMWSGVSLHNSENNRKHGKNGDGAEEQGRAWKALADLLAYYRPIWNAGASVMEENVRRTHRDIRRRKGLSELPDAADPDQYPPTDQDRI